MYEQMLNHNWQDVSNVRSNEGGGKAADFAVVVVNERHLTLGTALD